MTQAHNTTFDFEYQGFESKKEEKIENHKRIKVIYSIKNAKEEICPYCKGNVSGYGKRKTRLVDIPYLPGESTIYEITLKRYRCCRCNRTFTDKNPFKAVGMNITKRCAIWIFSLLRFKLSTLSIADIIGIHWNTVRKLEKMQIDHILKKEDEHNEKSTYRPYYLAIDEFAIRKGHRYATCVMDLVTGNILWVGKGRTINDFAKFFESYENSEYLSCVKAVAMDMNASYNRLVSQHFPNAEIVYDQYHVQSQFGRDVLGQVRLNAAKEHKRLAKEMISKDEIKREKRLYTTVKKARWILLSNGSNLKDEKKKCLNEILDTHSDIAVCYAMKEQMISLFALTDTYTAQIGWTKWFDAAINSGIPPLVKFAKQKLKRLPGLVAHAKYHINTGKLEGFNNKIKVAKRNAYGFRNLDYFFKYIRFLSISHFISPTQN